MHVLTHCFGLSPSILGAKGSDDEGSDSLAEFPNMGHTVFLELLMGESNPAIGAVAGLQPGMRWDPSNQREETTVLAARFGLFEPGVQTLVKLLDLLLLG